MNNNTHQQPRAGAAMRPAGLPFPGQSGPDGAFWSGAIGAGASIMVELASHIDVLSQNIGKLPDCTALSRPAVTHYLLTLKAIAAAWHARTRPALLASLEALTHVGTSLGQAFTQEALAYPSADGGKAAARVLGTLGRRLTAPAVSLASLAAEFDDLLEGMASATRELQADTLLVSERLRSDHVHAFLLSQQASTLQSKLDDATMRQDAYWLQGPHSEQIRQEIALHKSALEGVRRQLDHLHAEQATTRSEAHYLQNLMPSLSGYLGALDRMAGGVRATQAGTTALLAELGELQRLLAEAPAGAINCADQLRAAVPQWRQLAAVTARLRPACVLKTRGGRRT